MGGSAGAKIKVNAVAAFGSGIAAAAAASLAIRALFEYALERPDVAALSPTMIEGSFTIAQSLLLAAIAFLGALIFRQRFIFGSAPLLSLGAGAFLGTCGLTAALLLSMLAGVVRQGDQVEVALGPIVLGATVLLLQAASEEIFFRGLLQPLVAAGWGRASGIGAATVGFVLLHCVNATASPIYLVNLAFASIAFGFLANRSRGLLLPIGAHFGWDWAGAGLFGTVPNPGVGSFGALFNIDLVGSRWWGAGDDGLDSSIAATFAFVAIIAATWAWPRSAATPRARQFANTAAN